MTLHKILSIICRYSVCLVLSWIVLETVTAQPENFQVQVSPDGQRITFTHPDERGLNIYVADVDGQDPWAITYHNVRSRSPEWSPCGEWVAYIKVMPNQEVLTAVHLLSRKSYSLSAATNIAGFKWSPDSRRLACVTPEMGGADNPGVLSLSPASTAWTASAHLRVLSLPSPDTEPDKPVILTRQDMHVIFNDESEITWTEDSESVVFAHRQHAGSFDMNLSVVHVATEETHVISEGPGNDSDPICSPDGRWLAYLSEGEVNPFEYGCEIVILSAYTGEVRTVFTAKSPFPDLIGWSGDSRRLYYTDVDSAGISLTAFVIYDNQQVGIMSGAMNIDTVQLSPGGRFAVIYPPEKAGIDHITIVDLLRADPEEDVVIPRFPEPWSPPVLSTTYRFW